MKTKVIIKVIIKNKKEEIPPHANIYNGKKISKKTLRCF